MVLLILAISTQGVEELQKKMAKADKGILGAPFQALVLIPGLKSQTLPIANSLKFESTLHTTDILSAFVEEFTTQGGSVQELDFIVRDPHSTLLTKGRNLEFVTRMMTDTPFSFRRNRRDVLTLKHKSILSCLSSNGLPMSLEKTDSDDHILSIGDKKATVSIDLAKTVVLPFLTEACQLLELAKNQVKTQKKTGLVFEMVSVEVLLQNETLAPLVPELVKAVLSKVSEQ